MRFQDEVKIDQDDQYRQTYLKIHRIENAGNNDSFKVGDIQCGDNREGCYKCQNARFQNIFRKYFDIHIDRSQYAIECIPPDIHQGAQYEKTYRGYQEQETQKAVMAGVFVPEHGKKPNHKTIGSKSQYRNKQ